MDSYQVKTSWWFSKVALNLDPTLLPPSTDSFGLILQVNKKGYKYNNFGFVLEESVTVRKTKYPISTNVLLSDDRAYSCFSQFLSTVGITLDRDHVFPNILSGCRAITTIDDTSSTSSTTNTPFSEFLSTVGVTFNRDHIFGNSPSGDTSELESMLSMFQSAIAWMRLKASRWLASNMLSKFVCLSSNTTSAPFFLIDMLLVCVPSIYNGIRVQALEKVRVIEGGDEQCMICLDKFRVGSEVTRMPCRHVYHEDCIVDWLKINNICPVCRFKI